LASTVRPPVRETEEYRPTPFPGARQPDPRVVLAGVVVLGTAYLTWHLRRGWIPFDDGALAQSAERVLRGELPHRDFDDVYTGGLAYLNAAGFRIFGTTLWSLRIVLLAAFVAWLPAVHYIATRFVAPVTAGGITLLAVVWSVPNYPAGMPSWYNLFLATFGVAVLLRYLEDGRRRWLVLAGVAGGLSFLVKVVGVYYVAGVLLFLVFQSHERARAGAGAAPAAGRAYAAFVTAALALFVIALLGLIRRLFFAPEILHFVVPGAALAWLLARREWTLPAGTSRARFAGLAELLVPFLAGVALPVALFLVPYVRSGALGAFGNGVFLLPMKRFGFAITRPPRVGTELALVPLGLLTLVARRLAARIRWWMILPLAAGLAVVVVAAGSNAMLYRGVWYSLRPLVPVLTIAGVWVLARPRVADEESPLLRTQAMLLLAVTALCSLVQFPFPAEIYFCYVAPLALLTAVALFRYLRTVTPPVPATIAAFYMAFAVVRVNTSTLGTMGITYEPYMRTERLPLERGAIDVPSVHAAGYPLLLRALHERARGGYTWAAPDCPEIYFLSGLRNPTRSLFEFFDGVDGHAERVLRALDEHGVTAVVLNREPAFSPRLDAGLVAALERRYPYAMEIGPFQVRWRP
jgi:hypothetical protein